MNFLGIYFAGLDKFYLLPVFLFFSFFIIKKYIKTKKNINFLVHPDNMDLVFKNFSLKKFFLKTVLLIVALWSIFFALLQPQFGKIETQVEQEGRDLLILLDVSRSMMAKDLKPTRLDFAKLKIKNILSKLKFERVGLILFSGTSFVQCPLTADFASFLNYLDAVDTQIIASGTTAIDSALQKAVEVFSYSTRKNKLVLLLTDGEDFSTNLEGVKAKALSENIKLFILGIATVQGAPVPKVDLNGNLVGHEIDLNGQIVMSKLNEDKLQQISKYLNGYYFRSGYDESDINQFISILNSFEKEKFQDKKISYYQDRYPWLLGLAFFALALEWIL